MLSLETILAILSISGHMVSVCANEDEPIAKNNSNISLAINDLLKVLIFKNVFYPTFKFGHEWILCILSFSLA